MKIDKDTRHIQFTNGDVNIIAFTDYLRKGGIKWIIAIIALAMLSQVCRIFMTTVPLIIAYSVLSIAFVVILTIYTKKQNKYRKHIWQVLKDAGVVDDVEE
jgi:hypothetical protein